ncbi:hypothetical protein [Sodalis sp. RH19]|uniref:hypothetical protein n=1 Tax=Sodalis sp. RH19 TaxID=3394334 RepID=UPI0039B6D9F5
MLFFYFSLLICIQIPFADGITFKDFNSANYLPPGQAAATLGLGWVREDLSWANIEKTKGYYNWNNFDQKVLRAHSEGVEVLPLLAYTPDWDRVIPHTAGSPPKDYSRWLAFVRAAVERYTKPPYNIKYFQVWNEPTKKASYWLASQNEFIDKIYIPAANIIRNNKAKVVFGGWPASNSLKEYEETLNYHDAISYTDILDVHYRNLGGYNTLFKKYIATGKVMGLWQTELGYTTSPEFISRVYIPLLHWALKNNWHSKEQYKVFWYPGWGSIEQEPRGLTTTKNRQVLLTSNGQELALITSIFGDGALSILPVNVTKVDKNEVYGFKVGLNKGVIAITRDFKSVQASTITYHFNEGRSINEANIFYPGGERQLIKLEQNSSNTTLTLDEKVFRYTCVKCFSSTIYVVYTTK